MAAEGDGGEERGDGAGEVEEVEAVAAEEEGVKGEKSSLLWTRRTEGSRRNPPEKSLLHGMRAEGAAPVEEEEAPTEGHGIAVEAGEAEESEVEEEGEVSGKREEEEEGSERTEDLEKTAVASEMREEDSERAEDLLLAGRWEAAAVEAVEEVPPVPAKEEEEVEEFGAAPTPASPSPLGRWRRDRLETGMQKWRRRRRGSSSRGGTREGEGATEKQEEDPGRSS